MPTPSATGTGQGGTVYTPAGQPQAGYNFNQILQPEINQAIGGLDAMTTTPAASAWPQVQSAVSGIINNPYAGAAQDYALNASNFFNANVLPSIQAGATGLGGLAALAANQAPGTLAAGQGVYNTLTPQAQGAFVTGQDVLGTLSNLVPGATAAGQNTYSTLAGQVPGVLTAGGAIANAGFDPQNALFNRTQQQLLDQTSAINSMAGLGSTPYGASTTANALGNFDINWQNNLLNREQAGLAGLNAANTGAANLLGAGTSALYGGDTTAGNLLGTGANALYGGNTSGTNLTLGGLSGITNANASLGGLTGTAGAGYGGATNLLQGGATGLNTFGAQPYNTSIGIGGNNLGALAQLIQLGNQNYTLPQSILGNELGYLGVGQGASQLANTIGNTNFNQIAGGAGGIGQLLGSGLGLGSPSNPGYLAGLLGLGGGGFYGVGGGTGGL